MENLIIQIVAGSIVAIVSFGFGYFLFRAQRIEETKLEVFRRRLNSYESIATYLEELDRFSHSSLVEDKKELEKFVEKGFKLSGVVRLYVSSEIGNVLGNLPLLVGGLPDTLPEVEDSDGVLFNLMETEVGNHLSNWRVEISKKISSTQENF